MTEELAVEHDRNLRRLLLVRVGIATALLVPVLWAQTMLGTAFSATGFYALIGLTYGLSVLQATAHRWAVGWPGVVGTTLMLDTVLATLLVYAFGGLRSPLVLLYLVIAFGAGLMTARQTALALACLGGVLYGLVAHLDVVGWLPSWIMELDVEVSSVPPPEMYLRIFSVLLTSCLVAAVASGFAERFRTVRRELAEERSALEALQALNQQLLAGMSSGLMAAAADGRVVACNQAAERITGRDEDEIVGSDVDALLGVTREELEELDQRLERRQIYRTERRVKRPDGSYCTVGMSVTKVVPRGKEADGRSDGPWTVSGESPIVGGYIFMFQDLTDIKRMERLFWMRERMALLGEMSSSLAHEIRNPLASISGSLQVLRRGTVRLDSEQGERLMGIVTAESDRLSTIIENFLDYTRPEKLEAAEHDLVALVNETVELLGNSPEVGEHHTIEVESEAGQVVALVDAARIKQVLWNLCRNGLQAMPDGGGLSVRLAPAQGGAEVVVEDEGVGMPPEQVDQIFRPFVSRKEEGTGLGLAVVYRILQQHGARIEVESEVGAGTRFRLRFEDASVPDEDQPVVVVDRAVDEGARQFDQLSRSLRAD